MVRYKTVKIRIPLSRLPTRNWKQTSRQVRGLGSTIRGSYGNYGGTVIKTRERAETIKEKAKQVKYQAKQEIAKIKYKGAERYVLGMSIYDKTPSQKAAETVKKIRRHLGGGLYG